MTTGTHWNVGWCERRDGPLTHDTNDLRGELPVAEARLHPRRQLLDRAVEAGDIAPRVQPKGGDEARRQHRGAEPELAG